MNISHHWSVSGHSASPHLFALSPEPPAQPLSSLNTDEHNILDELSKEATPVGSGQQDGLETGLADLVAASALLAHQPTALYRPCIPRTMSPRSENNPSDSLALHGVNDPAVLIRASITEIKKNPSGHLLLLARTLMHVRSQTPRSDPHPILRVRLLDKEEVPPLQSPATTYLKTLFAALTSSPGNRRNENGEFVPHDMGRAIGFVLMWSYLRNLEGPHYEDIIGAPFSKAVFEVALSLSNKEIRDPPPEGLAEVLKERVVKALGKYEPFSPLGLVPVMQKIRSFVRKFPTHPPDEILKLSFNQLKEMHRICYPNGEGGKETGCPTFNDLLMAIFLASVSQDPIYKEKTRHFKSKVIERLHDVEYWKREFALRGIDLAALYETAQGMKKYLELISDNPDELWDKVRLDAMEQDQRGTTHFDQLVQEHDPIWY